MIILSHRGLPGPNRPENTVASVAAAFRHGADGVEVDLRLTADGVLALSHDPDLTRLAGLPLAVEQTPWLQLRAAAAGRGLAMAHADQVLTLAAGRRVVLELKEAPGGTLHDADRTGRAVGSSLLRAARDGTWLDVTVSSFSTDLLDAARAALPSCARIRTALLGEPTDAATALLRRALDHGYDELHPHIGPLLRSHGLVAAAHSCGIAVLPWTVNRRRDARRLHRLGVDGLITDVPASARSAVGAPLTATALAGTG